MQVLNTYRMKTPTRTIDLAPGAEPQTFANGEAYTLTPMERLISAEVPRCGQRSTPPTTTNGKRKQNNAKMPPFGGTGERSCYI